MQTGGAIPTEPEAQETIIDDIPETTEIESSDRRISINVAEDGKMNLEFDGEFQTHEAFGALVVSFLDLATKQFINPGLQTVLQSQKISENNVLEALKVINNSGTNSDMLAALQNTINQFTNGS